MTIQEIRDAIARIDKSHQSGWHKARKVRELLTAEGHPEMTSELEPIATVAGWILQRIVAD